MTSGATLWSPFVFLRTCWTRPIFSKMRFVAFHICRTCTILHTNRQHLKSFTLLLTLQTVLSSPVESLICLPVCFHTSIFLLPPPPPSPPDLPGHMVSGCRFRGARGSASRFALLFLCRQTGEYRFPSQPGILKEYFTNIMSGSKSINHPGYLKENLSSLGSLNDPQSLLLRRLSTHITARFTP